MTDAEAIAIYNEMAAKYNEVMALYDTCNCDGGAYDDKARIPLYDPDADNKHAGLKDILINHSNEVDGVRLIVKIANYCGELERLSLKAHGPLNTYHPNGYVQLYTEAQLDPQTGSYVDSTNGLGIDYVTNQCSDLDRLDPAPDSSEFLEFQVYPVINTKKESDIDSRVSAALATFNEVAALPKECVVGSDAYECNLKITYTINNNLGTLYSKSDIQSEIEDIYDDLMTCLKDDYANWLSNDTSTLAADIADLMRTYTTATKELEITASTLTYNAQVSGNLATVFYYKPGVAYFIDTDRVNTGADYCIKVEIDPIHIRVARVTNKYQTDVSLMGLSCSEARGRFNITGYTYYSDPLTTKIEPRSYNALSHLTSVTYSSFSGSVPSCSHTIILPEALAQSATDPWDYISSFPSLFWDNYLNIDYPSSIWGPGQYGSAVGYNGTIYYGCGATLMPEYHGLGIQAVSYLILPDPPSD